MAVYVFVTVFAVVHDDLWLFFSDQERVRGV